MTSFQRHEAFARREMFCIRFRGLLCKCGIAVRFLWLLLRALSAWIPNVKLAGIQLGDYSRRIRQ